MFKKNFVFIIVIAILLTLSCAEQKGEVVSFAVGGAPNEIDFWEKLIQEFEKEKGIKVNLLRQPTDTDQRRQGLLIPLKAKRKDPDVFLMDVGWIGQFAASNWLESLDPYVEKGMLNPEDFFSRVVNLADRYQGKLIALPIYVDAGLLYYRKDLLTKYGYQKPPQTWNELVDYSLPIQKAMRKNNNNFYGFVWQGAQYEGLICNFIEFAGSNNGGIVVQDEEISLNSPENIKATQFMYDLIHKYKVSPPNTFTEMKEEEVRIFFQQGNALFARNWPYAWALYQSEDSKVKGKVGITNLPYFPAGKSVATLGGWHIGISRYSDVKPQSIALIQFIVSFATQKKLAMELGWNPGRKDIYTDSEVLQRSPHFAPLRQVFENAQPRPNLPYYSQISEVLQNNINAILAGRETPEAALAKAEEEVSKIVEMYKQ
ncbi:MAG: ABC transporter substrate-binding protein [candidate division WOR-3 bacterium]|nr:ABC transporter substrate-binding protein [candidate division WOR-3 bacterium]